MDAWVVRYGVGSMGGLKGCFSLLLRKVETSSMSSTGATVDASLLTYRWWPRAWSEVEPCFHTEVGWVSLYTECMVHVCLTR